ncbi:MAG: AI-2E family transporter [Bacteroidota bacterium]
MSRSVNVILLLVGVVFILIITKNYLIPVVLALIIWYLIRVIGQNMSRFSLYNKLPGWIQYTLIFLLMFSTIIGVSELLLMSIRNFSKVLPSYQENVEKINASIIEQFNFDVIANLEKYAGEADVAAILEPIMNSLSGAVGNVVMIIIYCIFLLLEQGTFERKFRFLFKDEEKYAQAKNIMHRIDESFSKYILLKTFVSVLTGVLSYFALLLLKVDSPVLWSFLIFLLNYIPSIGSLLATAFPVIVAMLQYGEVMPGIYVLLVVGAIQLVVGNFIDPKLMGDSLNISSLVVLLALVVWGAIWGVLGMVLSVPITVMLIIIFSNFEATRPIAILLSSNGTLKD